MNPGVRTCLPRSRWHAALSLRGDEAGATAIEYGLIAALIVLAILGGLNTLGTDIAGLPLQTIIDAIVAARA